MKKQNIRKSQQISSIQMKDLIFSENTIYLQSDAKEHIQKLKTDSFTPNL